MRREVWRKLWPYMGFGEQLLWKFYISLPLNFWNVSGQTCQFLMRREVWGKLRSHMGFEMRYSGNSSMEEWNLGKKSTGLDFFFPLIKYSTSLGFCPGIICLPQKSRRSSEALILNSKNCNILFKSKTLTHSRVPNHNYISRAFYWFEFCPHLLVTQMKPKKGGCGRFKQKLIKIALIPMEYSFPNSMAPMFFLL